MIHLKIDLNDYFSFITAMDHRGHVLAKAKVFNGSGGLLYSFLVSYPPSKHQVVMEATCKGYWLWIF